MLSYSYNIQFTISDYEWDSILLTSLNVYVAYTRIILCFIPSKKFRLQFFWAVVEGSAVLSSLYLISKYNIQFTSEVISDLWMRNIFDMSLITDSPMFTSCWRYRFKKVHEIITILCSSNSCMRELSAICTVRPIVWAHFGLNSNILKNRPCSLSLNAMSSWW